MINRTDRSPRKHLIYYANIQSASGNNFPARLVDISAKGLKVVIKEKVLIGEMYYFDITLPREKVKDGYEIVHCQGKARWCRKHTNPEHYTAGFVIEGVTEKDREMLSFLIKRE